MDTANRRAGSSARATLEILIWATQSSIDAIQRTCPSAPSFTPMLASFRQTNAEATRTCAQLTGSACVGRLQ